jgi:hypothetical protein
MFWYKKIEIQESKLEVYLSAEADRPSMGDT